MPQELLQIPDVSLSALNSLIFGNNASSHFRELCLFVHFPEPLPDTMCLQQEQPATAKVLGCQLRLHLPQMRLLEICINVEEKMKRALCASSAHVLGSSATRGITMSFECAVDLSTDTTLQAEGAGSEKSDARQTVGALEEAAGPHVMPVQPEAGGPHRSCSGDPS